MQQVNRISKFGLAVLVFQLGWGPEEPPVQKIGEPPPKLLWGLVHIREIVNVKNFL